MKFYFLMMNVYSQKSFSKQNFFMKHRKLLIIAAKLVWLEFTATTDWRKKKKISAHIHNAFFLLWLNKLLYLKISENLSYVWCIQHEVCPYNQIYSLSLWIIPSMNDGIIYFYSKHIRCFARSVICTKDIMPVYMDTSGDWVHRSLS